MIDEAWFRDKIERSEYGTMYALAPKIIRSNGTPMTKQSLFKVVTGLQPMTLAEAYQFATLLDLDFTEVCLRALGKKPKR
jgi:hypothetical protein